MDIEGIKIHKTIVTEIRISRKGEPYEVVVMTEVVTVEDLKTWMKETA